MASLNSLMRGKAEKPDGGQNVSHVRVQQIHYSQLKGSRFNFYRITPEEVEELADSMLIVDGILQPLVVMKTGFSEYEILSGHKRKAASVLNVERGYRQFELLPCRVIDVGGLASKKEEENIIRRELDELEGEDGRNELMAEYMVICSNSTSREISPYEKVMQAVRLGEILPKMLQDDGLKGRALRKKVAEEMECSDGQVGMCNAIYNNLIPGAMELFKDGAFGFKAAYRISRLSAAHQGELVDGGDITPEAVAVFEEAERDEKSRPAMCEGQTMLEEVSGVSEVDTDTDTESMEAFEAFDPGRYTRAEWSHSLVDIILGLVFDGGRFPDGVMKELLKPENREASCFRRILEGVLPFETDGIRLEYGSGFRAYISEGMTVTEVPLWPFWTRFADRYGLYRNLSGNKDHAPVEDGGTVEEHDRNGHDYTLDDIHSLYDRQEEVIGTYQRSVERGALVSRGDTKAYRNALIIRDALTCLLGTYAETESGKE